MSPRYKKVLNDLKEDLFKNILLVLAIAVGVFGIGTILAGYSVIKNTMADNYLGTHPASATIKLEGDSIEASLPDSVRNWPGINKVERHTTINARMKIGPTWHPMLLFVIDDFNHKQTNTFRNIKGQKVPSKGTMLVERSSLEVMQADIQQEVAVKTAHGMVTKLLISGIVHDPSLAPARQEQAGYAYITLETLHFLGEQQGFDELRVIFDQNDLDLPATTQKARELALKLTTLGYNVHEVQVPQPRQHPHQTQMNTVLSMFIMFCFMVLLLSSVLLAVSMSTLLVRQVREIGILKTIGAGSGQIAGMYIIMVLAFSFIAVAAAIPLSRLAAPFLYSRIAILLNLQISSTEIPGWVTAIQWLSGIFIPLVVTMIPVMRGSRISVRQAITHYGVSEQNFGQGVFEKFLSGILLFNEAVTFSLRNIFRKRSRLVMTLILLGAAGSMFMTALNVTKAWDANLDKIYMYRNYDFEIIFNEPLQSRKLIEDISKIPGVKAVESWGYSSVSITQDVPFEIVHTYPDKGHGGFFMLAAPVNTEMIDLPLQQGSWLQNENGREVVLNQMARAWLPDVKIGDTISLSIDNVSSAWRVVGFVEDVGSPANAFVPLNTFKKVSGMADKENMLRIAFDNRSAAGSSRKIIEIEDLLEQKNIGVQRSVPLGMLHNAMTEHMGVLVNSLLSMSVLMAIVGALGLMSAMSMSVIERTREIGILRAIGATPARIRNLLLGEGLLTALLSVVLALVPSWLLSFYIGQLVGDMAFKTPLPLTMSVRALLLWLLIIIGGSIVALLYPARRAVKITTREALSYE